MLEWLSRDVFWGRFEAEYRPRGLWLDDTISVALSRADLERLILVPPHADPDDGDFPGPVIRWYGAADGYLFTVTYHLRVDNATSTAIGTRLPEPGADAWTVVRPLAPSATPLLRRVDWVQGHLALGLWGDERPSVRVMLDPGGEGTPTEMYQAATREEGEALLAFVDRVGSEFRYRLTAAEPTAATGDEPE